MQVNTDLTSLLLQIIQRLSLANNSQLNYLTMMRERWV